MEEQTLFNTTLSTKEEFPLEKIIEGLLFVSYQPLTLRRLAEITDSTSEKVKAVISNLQLKYAEEGFQLIEIAEGYAFITPPALAPYIEKLYKPRTQALSRAALETLSIIAYRQPVTRLEMEQIRQIKVDGVVSTLLEKGFIKEVGRREGPGRPMLYGTTSLFLETFGLTSLSELPPLENIGEIPENEKLLFDSSDVS